jgi:hypothetical protein
MGISCFQSSSSGEIEEFHSFHSLLEIEGAGRGGKTDFNGSKRKIITGSKLATVVCVNTKTNQYAWSSFAFLS